MHTAETIHWLKSIQASSDLQRCVGISDSAQNEIGFTSVVRLCFLLLIDAWSIPRIVVAHVETFVWVLKIDFWVRPLDRSDDIQRSFGSISGLDDIFFFGWNVVHPLIETWCMLVFAWRWRPMGCCYGYTWAIHSHHATRTHTSHTLIATHNEITGEENSGRKEAINWVQAQAIQSKFVHYWKNSSLSLSFFCYFRVPNNSGAIPHLVVRYKPDQGYNNRTARYVPDSKLPLKPTRACAHPHTDFLKTPRQCYHHTRKSDTRGCYFIALVCRALKWKLQRKSQRKRPRKRWGKNKIGSATSTSSKGKTGGTKMWKKQKRMKNSKWGTKKRKQNMHRERRQLPLRMSLWQLTHSHDWPSRHR